MLDYLFTGTYQVKHESFSDDEYVYFDGAVIRDENGYNMGGRHDEFMKIRKGDNWEEGWSLSYIGDISDVTMIIKNYHEQYEKIAPLIYENELMLSESGRILNLKGKTKSFKGGKVISVKPHNTIGRNDLCPCGSGKKFKKCCYLTMVLTDK